MRPIMRYLFVFTAIAAAIISSLAMAAGPMTAAEDGSFSIVVIPDTQEYLHSKAEPETQGKPELINPVFDAHTRWIVENLDRQRIVFVSHSGDIVDENIPQQWDVARRCMDRLHGRVPYGISLGNHDMKEATGDSSLFQQYFSQSRFENFAWYGGSFKGKEANRSRSRNNANSFQLFSAEGLDFIILHLECNAPDDVLAWADSVLQSHANRRAIVTTHRYLGPRERPNTAQGYYDDPKGCMVWKVCHGENGNSSRQMWEKCFRKHKNLFMIFCGDQSRTQAMRLTEHGTHGNPVHAVLSDYGRERQRGLRIYNFRPRENLILVKTYNPILDKLCEATDIVPDRNQHQFSLFYDMSPEDANGSDNNHSKVPAVQTQISLKGAPVP